MKFKHTKIMLFKKLKNKIGSQNNSIRIRTRIKIGEEARVWDFRALIVVKRLNNYLNSYKGYKKNFRKLLKDIC